MAKIDSTFATLAIAAAIAAAIGYSAVHLPDRKSIATSAVAASAPVQPAPRLAQTWAASAPGRVEARSGEVRVGGQMQGRIAEVGVRMNDTVSAGDVLLRFEDEEHYARIAAAEAEVAVRRRDRDAETVAKPAQDRRNAEDAVAGAERALAQGRLDLDRALRAQRDGQDGTPDLATARSAVVSARTRLDQARAALRALQAQNATPAPTRLEAAVAAARAELSQAEAALERTRVRAPADGTVLQVHVRAGEAAPTQPDGALLVFADISRLRVKAEVDERDIAKVRTGQNVVVRSDAFPDQDYTGKVVAVAQALSPPRLAPRGQRRPVELDVLEVTVDLDGRPPLLPGLRVDVLLKPDATAETAGGAKAN